MERELMPEVGLPELLIILVIVLLIFGPGRLTGSGAALGQAIREFRRGLHDREDQSVLEEKKGEQ